MTNLPRSATSLVLVAIIFSLTLAAPPSVSVEALSPSQPQNHEGRKITTLKNDAAKLRVMQISGKDKALKRALKDFEKIGKHPEWENSAVFIEEPEKKTATLQTPSVVGANSFAPQSQVYDDGAGSEMVLITQSGPEEYWSGIVYVHDATTGLDSTYTAVLTGLVMAQLETMDVIDELYYPPDGSYPIREEPPTNVDSTPYGGGGGDGGGGGGRGGFESPLLDVSVAKNNVKGSPTGTVINAAFRKGSPAPFGIIGWFKRYFRCVRRCEALTTMTCFGAFAVPHPPAQYPNFAGFFVCLGFGALASSIVCAFNTHACGG
ncbi:MAG: hypothetical protein DMF61_07170 [Blastocatellia bacterium AA13]|nr:MAG: hypothetical protein DMF61_07170 [Blastocatellia bacterium AA13]